MTSFSSIQLAQVFTAWLNSNPQRGWSAKISSLENTVVELRPLDSMDSDQGPFDKEITLDFKASFVKIVYRTTAMGSDRQALHKIGSVADTTAQNTAFTRILTTVERLWFKDD